MKAFGNLLREHLERANITTYRLAKITGIDRTLLSRVLAGERTLTRDRYETLLHYLPLTPTESEALNEAFVIAQVGEARYRQRQTVNNLLGGLAQIEEQWESDVPHTVMDADEPTEGIYENAYSVEMLLEALVLCELRRAAPRVRLTLPIESRYHCAMLRRALERSEKLCVEQIVQLEKGADGVSKNIETLGEMLPLAFAGCGRYQPYYYYGEGMVASLRTAMPYYILTTGCAVLLSGDLTLALVTRETATVQTLEKRFELSRSRCSLLGQRGGDFRTRVGHEDATSLGITYGDVFFAATPCFGRLFTAELVRKNLRFPPNDARTEKIAATYAQLDFNKLKEVNYFSRTGILDFARTGYLPYLPPNLVRLFDKEDRAKVLRGIRAAYDRGEIGLNLLDEGRVHVCRCASLQMTLDQSLDISLTRRDLGEYRVVSVREPTLVGAFSDFFSTMLSESNLVLPQESALAALDEALALCTEQ